MLGQDGNDGLIGRSIQKMFDEKRDLETLSKGESKVRISVELLEVYNEKVRDLLSNVNDQDLKVTSCEVVGNIVAETATPSQLLQVLQLAQSRRCVKATGSNAESSRSHMISTIRYTVTMPEGGGERSGRLNICDLAGSERLDKSGTQSVGVSTFVARLSSPNICSWLLTVFIRISGTGGPIRGVQKHQQIVERPFKCN